VLTEHNCYLKECSTLFETTANTNHSVTQNSTNIRLKNIFWAGGRLRLKCDGTRAETRFCLLAKQTSPFKTVGVSSVDYWQPRCADQQY